MKAQAVSKTVPSGIETPRIEGDDLVPARLRHRGLEVLGDGLGRVLVLVTLLVHF